MPKALTSETAISVSLVLVIIGFAWKLAAEVTKIEKDIASYNKQLTEIIPDIQRASVKYSEMESWLSTLRASNPNLTLPPFPRY